jgi:hypothetical protein
MSQIKTPPCAAFIVLLSGSICMVESMRKPVACALLISCLAACASDARWGEFVKTEPALVEARQYASVECTGHVECAMRWQRTMEYVNRYSATRIRYADLYGIETARPHEAGVVYLSATQIQLDGPGERARISLKGMCRGMYGNDGGPGLLYASCAEQIRTIELNFRVFVLAPA